MLFKYYFDNEIDITNFLIKNLITYLIGLVPKIDNCPILLDSQFPMKCSCDIIWTCHFDIKFVEGSLMTPEKAALKGNDLLFIGQW